jgi:hypothetical protein
LWMRRQYVADTHFCRPILDHFARVRTCHRSVLVAGTECGASSRWFVHQTAPA